MSTLVLQVDATYRPLGFVPAHKAWGKILNNKVVVLEEDYENTTMISGEEVAFPTVVQVPYAVKLKPLKDKVIIKRVLYARDNWQCQYCGKSVNTKTATVDHVKPKIYFAREGRPASDANTWDNVVTSCGPCNWNKGGRLPYECGMMPKRAPRKPDYVQTLWAGRKYREIHAKYVLQYYPKLERDIQVMQEAA